MPRRKREITPTLPIEPLDPSQSVEQAKDVRHQLWLIYSQLKDAESDAAQRLELLECSREDLGRVLNEINRQDELFLASVNQKPKSPRYQAAISNCRARQFNLTADRLGIQVENVLHLGDKISIKLRYTPHFLLPRLKIFFFETPPDGFN